MSTDVNTDEWVSSMSKTFPTWITKTFKKYSTNRTETETEVEGCNITKERFTLMPHQEFIRDYLQHKSPYRGLLLFHGLGVGKTCASIAVAEMMKNTSRSVMVMLPASLEMNYRNEIMKCGHEQYSLNQHWKFVSIKSKTFEKVVDEFGVSSDITKRIGGIWKTMKKKSPNYKELTSNEQQNIQQQVHSMISSRYEFFRYNGMKMKKYKAMTSAKNIFDDKLVIIDEAHLFISTVVNSNSKKEQQKTNKEENELSITIYRDLINAKNVKLVLLTGTPIINYPKEIAYTLNLLKGVTTIYKIHFKNHFTNNFLLQNHPDVEYHEIKEKSGHNRVELVLTPSGFQKNKKGLLVYVGGKETTDVERVASIVTDMKKSGVLISNYSEKKDFFKERIKLFPTEKNDFDDYFIDYEKNEIKNEDLFMRRMIGIVSYYESTDMSLYPRNLGEQTQELFFSEHQFNKYALKRDEEIKKDAKNKKIQKTGLFQTSGVFKTFSRILCNFSFPEEIERPFPKKRLSYMNEEIDIDEDLQNDIENYESNLSTKNIAKKKYEVKIMKAFKELDERRDEFLTKDLKLYSPKFERIIENMKKTPGTSLVYSQFRTMEGLGIFGLALKARGYAEMKIGIEKNKVHIHVAEEDYLKPKYAFFSTNKDISNIILKIFNSELDSLDSDVRKKLSLMDSEGTKNDNLRGSLIKVIMITQSGSAGISLKNVRQVHIMEPYWNKSRIDQVIGRANRTCSHLALPLKERNFSVFMYRMKMTELQAGKSKFIKSADKMKSTDQVIYELSKRKDTIISKLLKVIKRGSVDCSIHKGLNKDIECWSFPLDVNVFDRAYLSRIEDDYHNIDQQAISKIKVKPYKVIIDKNEYIWISDTDELFDYQMYAKSGVLDKVGLMKNNKNGWYKLTLFKK